MNLDDKETKKNMKKQKNVAGPEPVVDKPNI